RDEALMARLLQGATCVLALVDPPYSNGAVYGLRHLGTRTLQGEAATPLLGALPDLLSPCLAAEAHALIFCPWRTFMELVHIFCGETDWEQKVVVWNNGWPVLFGGKHQGEQQEWLCAFTKGRPTGPGVSGGSLWSLGARTCFEGRSGPPANM